MLVRDIMTSNVITVSSKTPVLEARKIMEDNKIRRLPVVDDGKLVGIVTKNLLRSVGPSQATSLSVWEINHLMAKMTVKEVMKTNVITVSPDMTVESAVARGQAHGVGATPVVENGKLIGITTTNDYFYKLLNPMMGIGEGGKRIVVYGADTPDQVGKVMEVLRVLGVGIKTVWTVSVPNAASRDLVVHLDTDDTAKVTLVMNELKQLGFHMDEREHR